MECYSEEVDSRSCEERKKQKKTAEEGGTRGGGGGGGGKGGDGSSIEVVKRPRGRPPGSKNKLKPPVVITREFIDPSPAMRPHVLEIPAGRDVAAALAAFSRHRSLGICVLAASGTVASVTLRQPPVPPDGSAAVTFRGRFEILSISATFFPPTLPVAAGGGFSVSLAGPQGRVLGGMVAGPLVAAGTVVVVAAAFAQPSFHRLPMEEQAGSASASLSGGGGGGGDEAAAQPHQDADDYNDHDEEAQHHYHHRHYDHDHDHGSSDSIRIYGGHFPPHVWNPTLCSPNPPPPPPPY
ncbi:AT-hook motif nuclear-localized protein 17-like [Phoenix dactylifera]|uniref:AT-hook motif nuclear-localized protein 17-like n=1 Tax=Phoenix dactylifera TaxID=42345 RepID=A0A8B9AGY9_PHODC|nr:AT-hook motif nuclear-localized protein 17-like [Phoenix dactylifera]